MISKKGDEFIDDSKDENFQEIFISNNQHRERLDQFLFNKLEKISRSKLQKLIKDGEITISENVVKPSHQVTGGERIVIHLPHPEPTELLPENIPLKIIFEDESLIVINKKAGMVVHPAYGNLTGTLANALVYHSKNLSTLSGEYRPGIVHRLDKDTSGLLVVAKNDFIHSQLSQQFSEHTAKREYRAIVWGHFNEKSGRIESYLKRNEKDRTRFIISEDGKFAVTNYEVIDEYRLVSLLKIRLETGRTHQIRVHLSSKGHPILGDRTYGGRHKQTIQLNQQDQQLALQLLELMPRQALHAKTLGFIHPETQQELIFDSELPEDMGRVIQFLEEQKIEY